MKDKNIYLADRKLVYCEVKSILEDKGLQVKTQSYHIIKTQPNKNKQPSRQKVTHIQRSLAFTNPSMLHCEKQQCNIQAES